MIFVLALVGALPRWHSAEWGHFPTGGVSLSSSAASYYCSITSEVKCGLSIRQH
ncbi:MAG: DUF3309 family protein [Terriglobia bacterium]